MTHTSEKFYVISRTGKIRDAWYGKIYTDRLKADKKCSDLNSKHNGRFCVLFVKARTVGEWEVRLTSGAWTNISSTGG